MQYFRKTTSPPRASLRNKRSAYLPKDSFRISPVSGFEPLDAVAKHNPASTSETTHEETYARRNACIRLKKLADDGIVERKKIAASPVWTLVEDDE
jgi:hypothetical protein